jgi:hypothetical protein
MVKTMFANRAINDRQKQYAAEDASYPEEFLHSIKKRLDLFTRLSSVDGISLFYVVYTLLKSFE